MAKIIREDFLQQDAFSNYDFNCPLYKTAGMMRCIITYFEDAKKVITESQGENKIGWNIVFNQTKNQEI
jgi:V-type H+-transporting ATPase subunit A